MSLLCLNCPEWLQDIAFTVVPDPLDHFIKMLRRITKNLNKLRSSWDHTGWAISYMRTIAEINFWWRSSSTVYVVVTLKHWDNFFLFCTFYKRFDVFPALQPTVMSLLRGCEIPGIMLVIVHTYCIYVALSLRLTKHFTPSIRSVVFGLVGAALLSYFLVMQPEDKKESGGGCTKTYRLPTEPLWSIYLVRFSLDVVQQGVTKAQRSKRPWNILSPSTLRSIWRLAEQTDMDPSVPWRRYRAGPLLNLLKDTYSVPL